MEDHHHRYADASCVLRVDVNCEECNMRMTEVFNSIVGTYNVNIDAEEGIVKMSGEVNPNMLLQAIRRPAGEHGNQLVRARITHPEVTNNNHNHNHNHYEYPSIDDGHCNHISVGALEEGGGYSSLYGRTLPNSSHHGREYYYPGARRVVEQPPHGCTDYCCQPLPEATYVPSYPPREYDPREDENWCSIM